MKRFAIGIVLLVLLVSFCCGAGAAGFTTNADAIEAAADSVLMIGAFDEKNTDTFSRGSGFVAFNSSMLITNYHVIDGATDVVAMDDDDNFYEIKYVLCADKDFDIAILEFAEPTGLKPLDLYASEKLKRGSPVVTIGSPGGGYKNTVTAGVVSSQMLREDGVPEIQFSAPISSGNSGGALLNDDGQVIGVTTETYINGQNINFAVNISVAKAMYKAWDGSKYSFKNYKSKAKMDFTGVYEQDNQPAVSSVVTEPPVEPVNSSTESWSCLNCGHENTTRFCQECGAEKPYWVCSCGRINSSSKFCGDCGKSIAEQVESFNIAMKDASEHRYSEAVTALESLGSFDSGSFETSEGPHAVAKDFIPRLYYDQGVYLQENNGSHEEIIASFEKAGDYSDAKEQIQGENARYLKSYYDAGVEHLANGEYEAAVEAFTAAGDYQDAKEKIKEVYYSQGIDLLDEKEYEASREALRKAGIYKDASEVIKKSYYLEAVDLMEQKEYEKALVRLNNASGYSDSKEKIKEIYYFQAEEAIKNGDTHAAKDLFKKADDYADALDRIKALDNEEKESIYDQALSALENGDYQTAVDLFNSIPDYRDADELASKAKLEDLKQRFGAINSDPETMTDSDMRELEGLLDLKNAADEDSDYKTLCNQIQYIIAQYCYSKHNYEQAISWFRDAGDYSDAQSRIYECKRSKIQYLIDLGKLSDAIGYYDSCREELKSAGYETEFYVMQLGCQGDIVKEVLALMKPAGIKVNVSQDENVYKEEYVQAIQKLEEHFGLKSDGNISLDDYSVIRGAVYPGVKSERVCELFEKLADLLYLSKLPESHDTYEQKYLKGVEKAEKALGLLDDGIVTQNEFDTIMEQKVDITGPAKLDVQISNDKATLTWPKVSGALYYEVSCDDEVLGTTEKTTWVQKNIKTGVYSNFSVRAKKYTVYSLPRSNSKYIPPFYTRVSVSDICKNTKAYVGKYVEVVNLKFDGWRIKGPVGSYFHIVPSARNGYELHILGKGSEGLLDISTGNLINWDWGSNDLVSVCSRGRIRTVSVKGVITQETYDWSEEKSENHIITVFYYKYSHKTPTIEAESISWR